MEAFELLRASAEEVSMEEKVTSTKALFRASEEIAQERGLQSPSRRRAMDSSLEDSLSLSTSGAAFSSKSAAPARTDAVVISDPVRTAPVSAVSTQQQLPPSNQVLTALSESDGPETNNEPIPSASKPSGSNDDSMSEAAKHLLGQMGIPIQPKPAFDLDITAALVKDIKVTEAAKGIIVSARGSPRGVPPPQAASSTAPQNAAPPPRPTAISAEAAASQRAKDAAYLKRYQRTREALEAKSSEPAPNNASRSSISTHPSRVANLLDKAEDLPWSAKLSGVLPSQSQIELFKNMKGFKEGPADPDKELRKLAKSRASMSSFKSKDSGRPGSASSGGAATSSSASKSKQAIMESAHRLSKPGSASVPKHADSKDPTEKYGLLDDAKNCTFRPTLTSTSAESGRAKGSHGDDDAKSNFIERQEAAARSRREEQDFSIGKAAYDKLVDKKICPKCGAKQSYDEVKEKRKKCPNCQVEYGRKITWNKVGKKFLDNTKKFAEEAAESKVKIREEVIRESKQVERRKFDKSTGTVRTVVEEQPELQFDDEMEKEFFDRMEKKMAEREKKKTQLAEELTAAKCPFKPVIVSKKKKDLDFEEDDMDEDPGQAFLKRMEDDIEDRRRSHPEKYVEKKPVQSNQTFKP